MQEKKKHRHAFIHTLLHQIPCSHDIIHSRESSLIPMRITRLPHLSWEARRRHDRFLILLLHLQRMAGSNVRRMTMRRDAAALNLQLARLALFLGRQRSTGPDRAVTGCGSVNVRLERREGLALLGGGGPGGGLRGRGRVVAVVIGLGGRETRGVARTSVVPIVFGWWRWRGWRLGADGFLEGPSRGRRAVGWGRRCVGFRRRRRQRPGRWLPGLLLATLGSGVGGEACP